MRLYIEDDAGNVRVVPLGEDPVTVGRADDNTLVLKDRNVSRHHARLRSAEGRVYLSDAGSRYGIRIEGGRLDGEVELRPGDMFQVGDFHMKLMAPDTALAEAPEGATPGAAAEKPRRSTSVEVSVHPSEAATNVGLDVGMMTLQEMEEVAKLGWRSDFYDDEPAARKRAVGRILLLLALVLVAAGLGFAYYKLYVADDQYMAPPPRQASPATPNGKAAPVEKAAPAIAPAAPVEKAAPAVAPAAPEAAPAPAAAAAVAAPAPVRAPEAAKAPAPEAARPARETAPAAAPAPRPAVPPPAAAPASAPSAASTTGSDIPSRIDDEIAEGNLSGAERLLGQCTGKGCFSRARALGDALKNAGQDDRAIRAYKKAMSMTQDPTQRTRLGRLVESLGGIVE